MNLEKELEISIQAAYLAGQEIMNIYQTDFEVEYKADQSPLTLADQKANKIITSLLKEHFPTTAILSEEDPDNELRFQYDWLWIVDPLDGTKEFVKKNGQFTVNIALTYKKEPVLGVIYAPVYDKLYFASLNQGAYLKVGNETKKIHVSDKLTQLIMIGSSSHASPEEAEIFATHQDAIIEQKSAGSSLKGCLVAEGEADIYFRYGLTSEWDICAMHAILLEAGGCFGQLDKTPMLYNRKDILNRKGFYAVNRLENLFIK